MRQLVSLLPWRHAATRHIAACYRCFIARPATAADAVAAFSHIAWHVLNNTSSIRQSDAVNGSFRAARARLSAATPRHAAAAMSLVFMPSLLSAPNMLRATPGLHYVIE